MGDRVGGSRRALGDGGGVLYLDSRVYYRDVHSLRGEAYWVDIRSIVVLGGIGDSFRPRVDTHTYV